MKTNSETGRKLSLAIGIYLIVKAVLNMILGGGIGGLIVSLLEAAVLYTGLMYINYVVAVLLAIVMLRHFKDNITNFGSNWIYLLEGIADIVCAVLLVIHKDIKKHFSNSWSEISDLIKK